MLWPIISFYFTYREGNIVAPNINIISNSLMASVAEEAIYRVLMISVMMRAYKDRDNYSIALIIPALLFAGASASAVIIQLID